MHQAQIGHIYIYIYIYVRLPSYLAVNSWHYFIISSPLTSRSDDKGAYHQSAHGRPTRTVIMTNGFQCGYLIWADHQFHLKLSNLYTSKCRQLEEDAGRSP